LHPTRFPEPVARDSEPAESQLSAAPEVGAAHFAHESELAEASEPVAEDEAYALRGALLDGATNEWPQEDPAPDMAHAGHDYYLAAEAHRGAPAVADVAAEEAAPPRRSVRGVILLLGIIGAGAVGFGATSG